MAHWKLFGIGSIICAALAMTACGGDDGGGKGGGGPTVKQNDQLCREMARIGNNRYEDNQGRVYRREGDIYIDVNNSNRRFKCALGKGRIDRCMNTEWRWRGAGNQYGWYHYESKKFIECTADDIFPLACNGPDLDNWDWDRDWDRRNHQGGPYPNHNYDWNRNWVYPDCSCFGNNFYPMMLSERDLDRMTGDDYDPHLQRDRAEARHSRRGQRYGEWRCVNINYSFRYGYGYGYGYGSRYLQLTRVQYYSTGFYYYVPTVPLWNQWYGWFGGTAASYNFGVNLWFGLWL